MATEAQRRRLTVGRTDAAIAAATDGKADKKRLAQELKEREWDGGGKVTVVHSVTDADMKRKRSFGEKDKVGSKDGEEVAERELDSCIPGVNFTCRKGLKPESPNQDSFVVVNMPGKWSLYGVFDGHGPNGHDVSDFALKSLVLKFFECSDFLEKPGAALDIAFKHCQDDIENVMAQDAKSSGTTCSMAFHNLASDLLTIAHVGDSRGCLYSGMKDVLQATEDHKPNLPGEKARIERNGGRVVFDGYYNYRVFAAKGMYPGLNMSRALGDITAHKEAGLTAEPELTLDQKDLKEWRGDSKPPLTLLLCSDGVWEFLECKDALKEVFPEGDQKGDKLKTGVDALAKKSWDAWMADSDNEISDDITVICVTL